MKSAGRIASIYFVIAVLWVGGSDWLLSSLFRESFPVISLYKGWAFVLITSIFLYVLLVKEFYRRDSIEGDLRKMAVRDPLTGLLNRASFADALEQAVVRAKRDHGVVGVIFIDLDGFKAVNDAHGHHVGDEVLVGAAKRLGSLIRAGDLAGRLGGDEFVVLVQGERREDGVERLAMRLLEATRQPFHTSAGPVSLTASLGLAVWPDHGSDGEQLLRAADTAMYGAKSRGRNRLLLAEANPFR